MDILYEKKTVHKPQCARGKSPSTQLRSFASAHIARSDAHFPLDVKICSIVGDWCFCVSFFVNIQEGR